MCLSLLQLIPLTIKMESLLLKILKKLLEKKEKLLFNHKTRFKMKLLKLRKY